MTPGAGPRSRALFRRASRTLVGGVDSPVRAFGAVGGTPVFFADGRGAHLRDVDGRRYLDFVGSWGANLLGNAFPAVVAAVRHTATTGLSFGAPVATEHEVAERLRSAVPTMERVRFVSSGTEAVMSAVRAARGFTRRTKVVKFAGGYHGHSDGLLARAGSGVAAGALPDSAGVPRSVVRETIVVPYNDAEAVERVFDRSGASIAAAVVEPVAGNMGVVPPVRGFLRTLSARARAAGALVVADEVITGFRLRRGTIGESLGLRPDLVVLGKVIGGGMPVAAYGGRREVMEVVAPLGPVYQAGTLAGNPVSLAAGAAALDALTPGRYRHLEKTSRHLADVLGELARESSAGPFTLQRSGSMLGLFFAPGPIENLADATRTDRIRYARFFHAALDGGVYLPPSPLETTFVSMAMTSDEIDAAAPTFRAAFRAAAEGTR